MAVSCNQRRGALVESHYEFKAVSKEEAAADGKGGARLALLLLLLLTMLLLLLLMHCILRHGFLRAPATDGCH
jgi:hypothetical protein